MEEPVSGSIEGLKETVSVLFSEYTKDFRVIKSLLDLTAKDYSTVLHSVNVMAYHWVTHHTLNPIAAFKGF